MTPNYILLHAENSAMFTQHQKLSLAADGDKYRNIQAYIIESETHSMDVFIKSLISELSVLYRRCC